MNHTENDLYVLIIRLEEFPALKIYIYVSVFIPIHLV